MTEQAGQRRLSPSKIVGILDKHIIGQQDAKRAVAIAFRNRWRRLNIDDERMQAEITPKNILMVGPTGVGKTEIARRLARLAEAPFIKVEATKFTEVGYVGRDVDSIIRDLAESSHKMAGKRLQQRYQAEIAREAVSRIASALQPKDEAERTKLELRIDAGEMDDDKVKIDVTTQPKAVEVNISGLGAESLPMLNLDEISQQLQDMIRPPGKQPKRERREIPISQALDLLEREAMSKRIMPDEIKSTTVQMAEQSGIVFIDEIDKIAGSGGANRADVSRQGVQRDLLPLIEGTTVQTKYGQVRTDHILFITSGSFHYARPSDLIPELQGRLPVRVDLAPLTVHDFVSILSKTENCLIRQYTALLATEGLKVKFTHDAVRRLAEIAHTVNERDENIGARRLHTLMERLVETVSFEADTMSGRSHTFRAKDVDKALGELSLDKEASRVFL